MTLGTALIVCVSMVLFCLYPIFRRALASVVLLGAVGAALFFGVQAWHANRAPSPLRPNQARTTAGTVYRVADCTAPIKLELQHGLSLYKFESDHFPAETEIDQIASKMWGTSR